MESDVSIIQQVLKGDADAFEGLVRRYERSVRGKAASVLHNSTLVDEAVQQTFVTAFEHLGSLRKPGAFPGWLLQIAYRHALSIAKLERRSTPLTEDRQSALITEPMSDRKQILLEAVSRLPKHEQIVVMTHYFDGYSTSEIAHMLGHPVGTVTKRLQRARTRLRKRLRSDDL